jgi:hypothetical protein
MNEIFPGDFVASLYAYSQPEEFLPCDGVKSLTKGLYVTQQPRETFGMSYRTLLGDEVKGLDRGYKIHLIYNAVVKPSTKSSKTLDSSIDPLALNWDLTAVPKALSGRRATAHFAIDSTRVDQQALVILEGYLYGSALIAPRLPEPTEFAELFDEWEHIPMAAPLSFYGKASNAIAAITNRALYGRMETAGASVEVRRNYAVSPRATTTWTGIFGTTGAGTFATISDARFKSGSARQMTWTTAGTGLSYISCGPSVALAAGEVWTFSFRIVTNAVIPAQPVSFDAGTWSQVAAGSIDHGDGTKTYWRTISVTGAFNRAPGAGYFSNVPNGTVILIGDAMAEKSPIFGGFFCGDVSQDADMTPAWVGTNNNSQSILQGASVSGSTAGASRVAISSTKWAASGTKSVRVIPTTSVSDTGGAVVHTFVPTDGTKQFTILATCHLEAPQTSPGPNARRIFVDSGQFSAQAPNAPGTTELRMTYTHDGSTKTVNLIGGTSIGNGDVWWDNVMVIEGAYTGPYFDGASGPAVINNQLGTPAWTGAANASTSTFSYIGALGSGVEGDAYRVDDSLWAFISGVWQNKGAIPGIVP